MNGLRLDDFIQWAKSYPKVLRLLEIPGVVLAGGAIRDFITKSEPKDFDFFFLHQTALDQARILMYGTNGSFTAYTQTFKLHNCDIQFVHKQFYTSPNSIIADFDFDIVRFAVSKNGIISGNGALSSIALKKISVNLITKPFDSLKRLQKYTRLDYDVQEAYIYILDILKTTPPKLALDAEFYEGVGEVDEEVDLRFEMHPDDIPF